MKLSKRAATELVLQNVQQVKTQINEAINGLNTTMQQVQNGVKQMQALMENVRQLDVQVRSLQQAQKVQQDAAQKAQQQAQTTTAGLVLAKKKRKKKDKSSEHPTPRDSEHNEKLPDFWRKNLDYGESPYMHMDKIEKITDEVPHGKRKKRKED